VDVIIKRKKKTKQMTNDEAAQVLHVLLYDTSIDERTRVELINTLLKKPETRSELDEIYPSMCAGAATHPEYAHEFAQLFRNYLRVINSGNYN
jgi:hypothetical protein